MTQAQVVAAVNAPVVYEPPTSSHGVACGYSQNDSIGAPIVDVTVDSNIDDETFKSLCNGTPLQGETITPVAGVGDAACFLGGGVGPTSLDFEKGCWAYSIILTGPAAQYPEATIEADEKAIALDMVPGL